MTEEDQATETEISNKVRQGNPLWVQLCLYLTAAVGEGGCGPQPSAPFSLPVSSGHSGLGRGMGGGTIGHEHLG